MRCLDQLLRPRLSIAFRCKRFFHDSVRGQLCIIRAPWIKHGKTFIGKGWTSYSIPRSNGEVVLGGTREVGDWEAQPRAETTRVILERAINFDRMLLPEHKRVDGTLEDLDLITSGVGRRPARKAGLRLEIDRESESKCGRCRICSTDGRFSDTGVRRPSQLRTFWIGLSEQHRLRSQSCRHAFKRVWTTSKPSCLIFRPRLPGCQARSTR